MTCDVSATLCSSCCRTERERETLLLDCPWLSCPRFGSSKAYRWVAVLYESLSWFNIKLVLIMLYVIYHLPPALSPKYSFYKNVARWYQKITSTLFQNTSQNPLQGPCSGVLYCNVLYAVSCIIGQPQFGQVLFDPIILLIVVPILRCSSDRVTF